MSDAFQKIGLMVAAVVIGMSTLAGCAAGKNAVGEASFDFSEDDGGFAPIFSDYPTEPDVEQFYEFQTGHEEVPVADAGKGLFISGNNHSDDLFMGYYKELTGLAPETEYQFTVRFKLATNVEGGMIGIGGSPGESVFVKCGVVSKNRKTSWMNRITSV